MRDNCGLTDVSIRNILTNCYNIEYISFINIKKLTDYSLFSIADNCPNLQILSVDMEHQMTDVGLICILTKCLKCFQINPYSDSLDSYKLPETIQSQLNKRSTLHKFDYAAYESF